MAFRGHSIDAYYAFASPAPVLRQSRFSAVLPGSPQSPPKFRAPYLCSSTPFPLQKESSESNIRAMASSEHPATVRPRQVLVEPIPCCTRGTGDDLGRGVVINSARRFTSAGILGSNLLCLAFDDIQILQIDQDGVVSNAPRCPTVPTTSHAHTAVSLLSKLDSSNDIGCRPRLANG